MLVLEYTVKKDHKHFQRPTMQLDKLAEDYFLNEFFLLLLYFGLSFVSCKDYFLFMAFGTIKDYAKLFYIHFIRTFVFM
jgi:hypothetical protein